MLAFLHGDHSEHRIISGFSGGCGKSLLRCGDLADAYAVERGAARHAGGLGAAVRVGLAGQRRHDAAVLRGAYLVRIAIAGETVAAVGVGCARDSGWAAGGARPRPLDIVGGNVLAGQPEGRVARVHAVGRVAVHRPSPTAASPVSASAAACGHRGGSSGTGSSSNRPR